MDIPAEWQQLHWKTQVKIANDMLAEQGKPEKPDMEASEARAIIDFEARRRAEDERRPTAAAPEIEGRTLDVFLDYDVWLAGGERIRADKLKAQTLPYGIAKKMLDEGKARRADPLPD